MEERYEFWTRLIDSLGLNVPQVIRHYYDLEGIRVSVYVRPQVRWGNNLFFLSVALDDPHFANRLNAGEFQIIDERKIILPPETVVLDLENRNTWDGAINWAVATISRLTE